MSNKKVAIEANLSNIRNALSQAGYECVQLNSNNANEQGLSAIVISGADRNVMGIQDVVNNVPVINSEGLTPQDVQQRLENMNQ